MSTGYPTITPSQLAGEAGATLVASVVGRQLSWIFRRNHGEHDFGIDGYIDIVTSTGAVTGRCLAVQIKYGESYLSHKEEYGYTYYGQQRHLNYLTNHPVPVIIVLCDPTTGNCYWQHFKPEALEPTDTAWKLCIPASNILGAASRGQLEAIAGPPRDYSDRLQRYWTTNKLILDAGYVIWPVDRQHHIERRDYADVVDFFERLRRTKSFAKKVQGKVELTISGYGDDPRGLWQIPEVVQWLKDVEPLVKHWFFFLRSEPDAHGLPLLHYCVCDARTIEGKAKNAKGHLPIEVDGVATAQFLERHFASLNEICIDLGIPVEEIRRISFAVARSLRIVDNTDGATDNV